METAGWPFRPTETNLIYFGDVDDHPVVFSSWEDTYTFIDSAQLKDTPGLREKVQGILHPAQEANITEETVEFYSGEQNGLPYDVEIRRMCFDEPKRETSEPETPAQNFRITDEHLGEKAVRNRNMR